MIVYKNIFEKLREAGYTQARLRKENLLSQGAIDRIHRKQSITMRTLNDVCKLSGCQPGEILEYVDDEEPSE